MYGFIIALLFYLIGIFVGWKVGIWTDKKRKYDGTLKIDRTDPVQDTYLVIFDTNLDDLPGKKWVKLHVKTKCK